MTRKIKFGPGFKVRERISIISLSFICNPESNSTRWDVYIELLLRSRPEDYKSKVQIQEPMCVWGVGNELKRRRFFSKYTQILKTAVLW